MCFLAEVQPRYLCSNSGKFGYIYSEAEDKTTKNLKWLQAPSFESVTKCKFDKLPILQIQSFNPILRGPLIQLISWGNFI